MQSSIYSFFTAPPPPPRGRGRPSGSAKKHGRPKQSLGRGEPALWDALRAPAQQGGTATWSDEAEELDKAGTKPKKEKRVDYSKGAGLALMQKAVHDWDHKVGFFLKELQMTPTRYAVTVGIPFNTLRKFICKDI